MTTFDLSKNPFFTYTRIERTSVPPIIEGADPTETIERVKDIIDLSDVKRFVTVEDGVVVAIMKDGHEEASPVPVLVKGKMEMQTRRSWTYTQIPIEDKEDIARLFALLEQ